MCRSFDQWSVHVYCKGVGKLGNNYNEFGFWQFCAPIVTMWLTQKLSKYKDIFSQSNDIGQQC